ncbi:peptidoglycan-binding protein [Streptomyces sp. NPDC059009]|uniref:peptidoglycan-binding domain-containing protein n=1 Tax=Streptomyces sp. NPDC059009 TaxID=3346694 RepID=UPI0036884731
MNARHRSATLIAGALTAALALTACGGNGGEGAADGKRGKDDKAAASSTGARNLEQKAQVRGEECGWEKGVGMYCGRYKGDRYTDYGDRGLHVEEIQQLILQTTKFKGHMVADGKFGPDTLAAVKWYQRTHRQAGAADGKVGPRTWAALRQSWV